MARKHKKERASSKVGADFDWHTLMPGDRIYLVKGNGPYTEYINGNGVKVRESMGEYGWFTVDKLDENGIHAYSEYGFSYIWMSSLSSVSKTGTIRVPHKIGKVIKFDGEAQKRAKGTRPSN